MYGFFLIPLLRSVTCGENIRSYASVEILLTPAYACLLTRMLAYLCACVGILMRQRITLLCLLSFYKE